VTHISSKLYVHTWMKCRHVVAVLGKKGPLHVVKAGDALSTVCKSNEPCANRTTYDLGVLWPTLDDRGINYLLRGKSISNRYFIWFSIF
jgi:hypothetical protein